MNPTPRAQEEMSRLTLRNMSIATSLNSSQATGAMALRLRRRDEQEPGRRIPPSAFMYQQEEFLHPVRHTPNSLLETLFPRQSTVGVNFSRASPMLEKLNELETASRLLMGGSAAGGPSMGHSGPFMQQPSPWLLDSVRNSTLRLNSLSENRMNASLFQLNAGGGPALSSKRSQLIDALLALECPPSNTTCDDRMVTSSGILANKMGAATGKQTLHSTERLVPITTADMSVLYNPTNSCTTGQRIAAYQEEPLLIYVEKPSENDVLCGRGGRSNHWVGNKRYRKVINNMRRNYRGIETKAAKTDLSAAIVNHVQSCGGRFLRLDNATGKYIVLSTSDARKKTSQALRESKDLKWLG